MRMSALSGALSTILCSQRRCIHLWFGFRRKTSSSPSISFASPLRTTWQVRSRWLPRIACSMNESALPAGSNTLSAPCRCRATIGSITLGQVVAPGRCQAALRSAQHTRPWLQPVLTVGPCPAPRRAEFDAIAASAELSAWRAAAVAVLMNGTKAGWARPILFVRLWLPSWWHPLITGDPGSCWRARPVRRRRRIKLRRQTEQSLSSGHDHCIIEWQFAFASLGCACVGSRIHAP
jgi:hypothetical protein